MNLLKQLMENAKKIAIITKNNKELQEKIKKIANY